MRTFLGARADRLGQRRIVGFQSLAGGAGLVGIVLVVAAGLPWGIAAVTSAVAGLLLPQIGPLARVRWRPITAGSGPRQHRLVDTAFSYEGAADEASFVLGPALIGLAVSIASPTVALVVAAGMLVVFGTWFALDSTATLTHAATSIPTATVARLMAPSLVVLCAAQLLVGTVFGSVQTGTSVLATAAGAPGLTGYFHALLGVGSVVAGLAVAALPTHFALWARLRVFAAGLLVLAAPLLLVGSLASLVPVLLLLGCTIAPYMITTFTLAERTTPPSRTGAAMTVLAGATGLGYAVGAALAGALADSGGHTPAYAVTVAAGAAAVLVSLTCGGLLRRAEESASLEAAIS